MPMKNVCNTRTTVICAESQSLSGSASRGKLMRTECGKADGTGIGLPIGPRDNQIPARSHFQSRETWPTLRKSILESAQSNIKFVGYRISGIGNRVQRSSVYLSAIEKGMTQAALGTPKQSQLLLHSYLASMNHTMLHENDWQSMESEISGDCCRGTM